MNFGSPWHHLSKRWNVLLHFQKAPTGESHRWKPQVTDWPCSCTAVLDIMSGGMSDNVVVTLTAQDWWQAQKLQTEPCCFLWPCWAWELNASSPHGPGPHTTQHHSSTDYHCPVNTKPSDRYFYNEPLNTTNERRFKNNTTITAKHSNILIAWTAKSNKTKVPRNTEAL